ncbi:MAG: cation-transporting P-type ATPase [Candidatus Diapherotrites archaeon]|nr:cation-transporting P-type ATPase [Candidatus Diapherotrites archaeon]
MHESGYTGLNSNEAKERLKTFGFNEIFEVSKVSPQKILLRQISRNFIVYLLFIAATLSFIVSKSVTAYTIFAIIIIIVSVGFIQEYKAEKAIKALKSMLMPISVVIRDGRETEVPSRELVPGDIVILRTGEKVPADCIILHEKDLKVDESVLTGESEEIKKVAFKHGSLISDKNMLFMGTLIMNGKAIAKVESTGMATRFGKIASMVSKTEKHSMLQEKINKIAKVMVVVALLSAIVSGTILASRNMPLTDIILVEIALAIIALSVAAFPEGLPLVLIITLAIGVRRMAQKNAIVNRMSVIETLGETTVICSDKTGTITKGEMTVKKIITADCAYDVSGVGYEAEGDFLVNGKKIEIEKHFGLQTLIKASVLCNDARITRKGTDMEFNIFGSKTEAALLIMAAKAGVYKDDLNAKRIEEVPFTSESKMMAVLCQEHSKFLVYAKGAPEAILKRCAYIIRGNSIEQLNDSEKKSILHKNRLLAKKGYRNLALAYLNVEGVNGAFEKDMVFLGIASMEDPPREEVKEAIKTCHIAGIDVKMITGDHKETAISIASQIGLRGGVVTGDQLDKMSDEELQSIVKKTAIFARVRPEHKMRIVKALKNLGEIVTMTGDGVNDAPALKEAHIGVAMGTTGTDVSREAADLILKDDNFATIVTAISEGRTIFNNMKKFISYKFSCNFAEMSIIMLGLIATPFLVLLPLQILFMNLVTDDLPAITLGLSPPSFDVMKSKPRRKTKFIDKESLPLILLSAFIMGVGTISIFMLAYGYFKSGEVMARTAALVTLIIFEIANAFNFRSLRYGFYELPLFANKHLVYASFASIMATILIVYTPLNRPFETTPLPIFYWGLGALLSISVIVAIDIMKFIIKQRNYADRTKGGWAEDIFS